MRAAALVAAHLQKAVEQNGIGHVRQTTASPIPDTCCLSDFFNGTCHRGSLSVAPLTPEQARDLLEIIDDRHGRGSTIVTSQLPVDHWHEVIGNPTIADAVLDRLVHNAHRLTLKGDSMRKIAAKRSGLDASPAL